MNGKVILFLVLMSTMVLASDNGGSCSKTYNCVNYVYLTGAPIIIMDPWCSYQNNISVSADCGDTGVLDNSTTTTEVCSASSIMSSHNVGDSITMLSSAVDTGYVKVALVDGATELSAYPTHCGGDATSMAINGGSAFFGFYNATQLTSDGWSVLDDMIDKVWDNWYSANT